MKHSQSKLIIGSAIGLAALAVAIDHTRHTLPAAETHKAESAGTIYEDDTPCSLDAPCSLDNPCSLDESDTPCGLD